MTAPLDKRGLLSEFRDFVQNVPPRSKARDSLSFTGADTAWLIKYVYDMISKIRARHGTRNEQGYNSISGCYRFISTVRP